MTAIRRNRWRPRRATAPMSSNNGEAAIAAIATANSSGGRTRRLTNLGGSTEGHWSDRYARLAAYARSMFDSTREASR
jgi:hypothetical protein